MKTTKFEDYTKERDEFYTKHNQNGEYCEYMSDFNNGGLKITTWNDGQWYESTRTIERKVTIQVYGEDVTIEVKLLEIEYWSNEDSESKFCYRTWH